MQPQRAEQYRQHVGLVSNLIAAHQQQAAQAQAQQLALQAQQRERAAQQLEQYRLAEVKRYEEATAHENPETMRTLRENAFPMIERHYGVPEATMRALASGAAARRFYGAPTLIGLSTDDHRCLEVPDGAAVCR